MALAVSPGNTFPALKAVCRIPPRTSDDVRRSSADVAANPSDRPANPRSRCRSRAPRWGDAAETRELIEFAPIMELPHAVGAPSSGGCVISLIPWFIA